MPKSPMKKQREFKPGETIAFYNNGYRYHGEYLKTYDTGRCQVRSVNGNDFHIHPKQCRRLRPKKKEEPKERWLLREHGRETVFKSMYGARDAAKPGDGVSMVDRMLIVGKDEVVVSRDDLAKAWDAHVADTISGSIRLKATEYAFTNFCAALGLPGGTK